MIGRIFSGLLAVCLLAACDDGATTPQDPSVDQGPPDRDPPDRGLRDARLPDTGIIDAGLPDASPTQDAQVDAASDAAADAATDGFVPMDQAVDAGPDACAPTPEICDGLDNDCNGVIDDIQGAPCGVGACAGQTRCVDGAEVCDGDAPGQDRCAPAGMDEDCDGAIDEGCTCTPGLTEACETPAGCAGMARCVETCDDAGCTSGFDVCAPVDVVPEMCDGQDNDCDGRTDEELIRPCGSDVGACIAGQTECVDGAWTECDGVGPAPEQCDGEDRDCDGQVDELSADVVTPIEIEEATTPQLFELDGGVALTVVARRPNVAFDRNLHVGVWEADGTVRAPLRPVLSREQTAVFHVAVDGARMVVSGADRNFDLPDLGDGCPRRYLYQLDRTGAPTTALACQESDIDTGYRLPPGSWRSSKMLVDGPRVLDFVNRDGGGRAPAMDLAVWSRVRSLSAPQPHWPEPVLAAPVCRTGRSGCEDFTVVRRPGGAVVGATDGAQPMLRLLDGAGRTAGPVMRLDGEATVPRLVRVGDVVYAAWGAAPAYLMAITPEGVQAPVEIETAGAVAGLTWDGTALVVWSRGDGAVWTRRHDRAGEALSNAVMRARESGDRVGADDYRRVLTERAIASVGGRDFWVEMAVRDQFTLHVARADGCAHRAGTCDGAEAPLCDVFDADCDGRLDEAEPPGMVCLTSRAGACAAGVQATCDTCVAVNQPALQADCGADVDCDGRVDDPLPISVQAPVADAIDELACADPDFQLWCGGRRTAQTVRATYVQTADGPIRVTTGRRANRELTVRAGAPAADLPWVGLFSAENGLAELVSAGADADSAWVAAGGVLQAGALVRGGPGLFLQQVGADGPIGDRVEVPVEIGPYRSAVAVNGDRVAVVWETADAPGLWSAVIDAEGELVHALVQSFEAEDPLYPTVVQAADGGFLVIYSRRDAPLPDERYNGYHDITFEVVVRTWSAAGDFGPPVVVGGTTGQAYWRVFDDRNSYVPAPRVTPISGPESIFLVWSSSPESGTPFLGAALDQAGAPLGDPVFTPQTPLRTSDPPRLSGHFWRGAFTVLHPSGRLHRFDAAGQPSGIAQSLGPVLRFYQAWAPDGDTVRASGPIWDTQGVAEAVFPACGAD